MYTVIKKETYDLILKYLQTKPWGEVNIVMVPLLTQAHHFEDLPEAVAAPFKVGQQMPPVDGDKTEEKAPVNIEEARKKKK